MKRKNIVVFFGLAAGALSACNSPNNAYQPPSSSSGSPNYTNALPNILNSQPSASGNLTDSKVETAVNSMLADWRLGGSVRVKGVQEIPQQNAAIADLQFNSFEYGITNEGGLVKAKDFAPKPMPKDQSRYPTMEEMFPQRKAVYSKDGKATLSHYTDGRWVLKEVHWGFDTGVKGNVEIR